MNTAILFSTLIFSASSSICDVPGLCNGEFVGKVNALDSFDCWKKCISTDECNYASFMPCYVSNYQLPISKKIFTFQNAIFSFTFYSNRPIIASYSMIVPHWKLIVMLAKILVVEQVQRTVLNVTFLAYAL